LTYDSLWGKRSGYLKQSVKLCPSADPTCHRRNHVFIDIRFHIEVCKNDYCTTTSTTATTTFTTGLRRLYFGEHYLDEAWALRSLLAFVKDS
jgi:hypothetical protein